MIKGYACKEQGGQLEPFEYDPGELGADEVEVAVEYCGICHSDLSMIDTGLSTTRSKEESTRELGATDFIATQESPEDLEKATGRFDFIISTVSADVNWNDYINALSPSGTLVICGVPDGALQLMPFPLIVAEKKVGGGRAGSPSDTQAMLEFCVAHDVAPMCEPYEMKEINQAVQRVRDGKARYRVVVAA